VARRLRAFPKVGELKMACSDFDFFVNRVDLLRQEFIETLWTDNDPVSHAILDLVEIQNMLNANAEFEGQVMSEEQAVALVDARQKAAEGLMKALDERWGYLKSLPAGKSKNISPLCTRPRMRVRQYIMRFLSRM
jgi:hypothetical protein